ncbi:MAG: heme exporter protein CcmB [Alphaproteobacteria bacterium]|nr:heme exporter protein CcmB [Alphaproteobacteria bacterium]
MTRLLMVLHREWTMAFKHQGNVFYFLAFMVVSVSLFPFAFGVESHSLTELAPGIIWLTTLFAAMMSLPHLLEKDYEDGVLEQMVLQGVHPAFLIFLKILTHWLLTGVVVVVVTPVFGLLLALPESMQQSIALSVLCGSPAISLVGVGLASLMLGVSRASRFLPIIVFPLQIPLIVLGVAASKGQIGLVSLVGLDLFLLPLALVCGAYALRHALAR